MYFVFAFRLVYIYSNNEYFFNFSSYPCLVSVIPYDAF